MPNMKAKQHDAALDAATELVRWLETEDKCDLAYFADHLHMLALNAGLNTPGLLGFLLGNVQQGGGGSR